MTEDYNSFIIMSHMVYCVIQKQFINIQFRDASKAVNMVRIGEYIYIVNIARTGIASLYFQCYNNILYLGHPRGSTIYRLCYRQSP